MFGKWEMEEEWKCGAWFFPSISNQGLGDSPNYDESVRPNGSDDDLKPAPFDQDLTILRPT
jgi:hypothetical protein